jgi:hypothetical protein
MNYLDQYLTLRHQSLFQQACLDLINNPDPDLPEIEFSVDAFQQSVCTAMIQRRREYSRNYYQTHKDYYREYYQRRKLLKTAK